MPALIIHEPGRASRVFILRKACSLIGSGVLNDERITCKGAQAHHLAVLMSAGECAFEDKSGKGILLNGTPTERAALKDGDEVKAGEARLRFDAAYTHDGAGPEATRVTQGGTDVLDSHDKSKTAGMIGLLIFRGGERKTWELVTDPVHIGSASDNTIPIPLKYVTAYHCRIYQRGGGYWLLDRDSTNGTFVDGVRIKEAELHDCATIRFGKPEAVFRLKPAGQGRVEVPVFEGMAGNHPEMVAIFQAIRKNTENNLPVLITGETGTGKELVAMALHRVSGRPAKKYMTLNCATLPRELAESELFGHEKGAFTGAHEARAGAFEAADGGTLFLDEIGELPMEMQAKLLRAVQYGEVKRVGSNRTNTVNTRIVAATNRALKSEIAAGKFREDLFYRLNVVPIALPPLRERREDVPAIADYLLDEISEGSWALTDRARARLASYDWPGNIRELRNVLSVAMNHAKGGRVDAGDLKFESARLEERMEHGRISQPGRTMEEIEREAIEDAVRRHNGDKQAAAKELGIGFSTLKGKTKK